MTALNRPEVVLSSTDERVWVRRLYAVIALFIAIGFFYYTHHYWFTAHHGNDQNGYMVGGRFLLETGTMRAKPTDAFETVGRMWVTGHEPGTFYPKYPIGLPAIYAVARALGGNTLVFLVNPIAMTLALLGVFAMTRRLVGSFYGLLGMLILAANPVTLGLVNNANSHATAIFCVVWGLHLALVWWQQPRVGWRSWAAAGGAGLLLGYSVTIRYTEGLLLLPMGLCILYVLWDERKTLLKQWQTIAQAFLMCAAWALPVVVLLLVNKAYFNSWTGYDPTHESTAFLWANLQANWDMMLKQFYLSSLIFVFPLSLIGLCIWFRDQPRQAAFIAAWALPCVFIYLVYYWAPERLNLGYSRFFFTAFPPLAITACFMMKRIDAIAISPRHLAYVAAACGVLGLVGGALTAWKIQDGWGPMYGSIVGLLGGAFIGAVLTIKPTSLVAGCGLAVALIAGSEFMETETRWQFEDQVLQRDVKPVIPQDAVVFSKDRVVFHLQADNHWKLYSVDQFHSTNVRRLGTQIGDMDNAQPFQAERAKALHDLVGDKTEAQRYQMLIELIANALAADKRVFIILPKPELLQARRRFLPIHAFETVDVLTSVEPSWVEFPKPSPWSQDARPRRIAAPTQWQVVEVKARKPRVPTTKAAG